MEPIPIANRYGYNQSPKDEANATGARPMGKVKLSMGRTVIALFTAFCLAALFAAAPLRAQDADQLQIGKLAYESRQFETAFRILKPFAVAGNAEAQLMVGDMYNLGAGVARDNSVAIEWYRKSATQGNVEAIQMLGQGMRLLGESTN